MNGGKRKKNTLALELHDDCLRYVTTKVNEGLLIVTSFGEISLEKGVIQDGEIIGLELISKLVKKICRPHAIKHLVYVLPIRGLEYETVVLPQSSSKKALLKHLQETNALNQHSLLKKGVCHVVGRSTKDDQEEYVTFSCIHREKYRAYELLAKNCKLTLTKITSPEEFLMKEASDTVLVTGKHDTSLIIKKLKGFEYKQFGFSYLGLRALIMKELHISQENAEKILRNHGVLRSHKEEKIYKKIIAQLQPLFSFLTINKKNHTSLTVVESYQPLAGLDDIISSHNRREVVYIQPSLDDYTYLQNVISIPQRDIYKYRFLLASLKA